MIFIPGNVPSLKNSKISTTIGKGENKRTILLPSKAVKNYLQKVGIKRYSGKEIEGYSTRANIFSMSVGDYFKRSTYPVMVQFHFVRDSRRKFDFHNAVQIIADLLVAHGFIQDDDMDHFLPFPMAIEGKWYSIDQKRPGVYLKSMADF